MMCTHFSKRVQQTDMLVVATRAYKMPNLHWLDNNLQHRTIGGSSVLKIDIGRICLTIQIQNEAYVGSNILMYRIILENS